MTGERLYVLGPVRLERDGQTMDLRRQSLTLLGYLAVSGERHHATAWRAFSGRTPNRSAPTPTCAMCYGN